MISFRLFFCFLFFVFWWEQHSGIVLKLKIKVNSWPPRKIVLCRACIFVRSLLVCRWCDACLIIELTSIPKLWRSLIRTLGQWAFYLLSYHWTISSGMGLTSYLMAGPWNWCVECLPEQVSSRAWTPAWCSCWEVRFEIISCIWLPVVLKLRLCFLCFTSFSRAEFDCWKILVTFHPWPLGTAGSHGRDLLMQITSI